MTVQIPKFLWAWCSVAAFWILNPVQAFAQTGPSQLNVTGYLFQAAGTPVTGNVNFKIEVMDATGTCVLYSEEHLTQDLTAAKGGFSLQIGLGSSKSNKIDAASATDLSSKVFLNSGAVAPYAGCAGGVNLNAGDNRVLRVWYNTGSGYTAMSPDVPMSSAAYAMVADTLQGKTAANFVQVRDDATYDLNQTNVESIFSAANFAKLTAILSGNVSNQRLTNVTDPTAASDAATKGYADANVGGKIGDFTGVGPATGDGKTLIWDQAQNKWVTGNPVATDATKLPLAGGTMTGAIAMGGQNITNIGHMTMAAQKTLNLGTYTDPQEVTLVAGLAAADKGKIWFNTTSNTFKVWNGTAAVNSADPTGAAGGDLTGTYPNPTIGNSKVVAAAIASSAVTTAKVNASNAVAGGTLVMVDSIDTSRVEYKACALGEALMWTAGGWACTNVATFLGTSGVTAATYGSATQVGQFAVNAQGRVTSATNVAITFPVVSVAGKTGAVTLNTGDLTNAGTAATKDFGTAAGNLVELDGGGKIPSSLLPSSSGDIQDVIAGSGLTGGGSSGSVTLNIDVGTTTGKIVQMAASDKLPAVDGSNLTNINVSGSNGYVQNGNSFGGAATLGTNDNFALNFETNNSTAVTIDNAGKMGVGTTAPGRLLHVAGAVRFQPSALPGTPAAGDIAIDSGNSNKLKYYDGSTWVNADGTSGNPGAYRTANVVVFNSAMNAGTHYTVDISGVTGAQTTHAYLKIEATGGFGKYRVRTFGSAEDVNVGTSACDFNTWPAVCYLSVSTDSAGKIDFWVDSFVSPIMSLVGYLIPGTGTVANGPWADTGGGNLAYNGGNIGIGTANPAVKLDVAGVMRVTDICDETGANCKDISSGWGAGGDIDGVYSGTGLTGGFASGGGTLSVDVGTVTGKIVQMAASNKLPAVDGSNLTGITTSQVTGAFANAGNSFGADATLGTNDGFALNFETNNTTAMTINGSGYVGIGTGSPSNPLTLMANGNVDIMKIQNLDASSASAMSFANESGTYKAWFGFANTSASVSPAVTNSMVLAVTDAASPLVFGTGNPSAERMRITAGGNVGIGTNNPAVKLDVAGVMRVTDICDETGANCKDISSGWGAGGDIDGVYSGTGLSGGFTSGSGTLSVDVGTTTGKIVQMAASDKLPAVNGSNLTQINAVKLQTRDVSGTAPTSNQVLTWNNGTSVWEPAAAAPSATSIVQNGNSFSAAVTVGSNDNFALNFETNNATAMTILPSGFVGIGTTSPANNLHVDGADTDTGISIRNRSSTVDRFPGLTIRNYVGATNGYSSIDLGTYGGTSGTTTATGTGKTVGNIVFRAYDGAASAKLAQIKAGTGSAFAAGDNEGFLSFETNDGASANPSEKMRITHAGNVGIGTTNPAVKLDVAGVMRVTDICDETGANCKDISSGWGAGGDIDGVYSGTGLTGGFASGSGTLAVDVGTVTGKIVQMAASDKLPAVDGSNLTGITASQVSGAFANSGNSFGAAATLGTNDNFALNFEANNSTAMTVLPGGNIGIGSTSPTSKLDVVGTMRATGSSLPSAGTGMEMSYWSGEGFLGARTLPAGTNVGMQIYASQINFSAQPSGFGSTMVITSSGTRVGTSSSPVISLFNVVESGAPAVQTIGRYSTTLSNTDSIGKLQFWNNDTQLTTQKIFADIEVQASQDVTTDAAAGNMIFRTTGTAAGGAPVERMRILANGNVGIGSTAPAAKLDVAGTIRATDICDETGANCKDISGGWGGGGSASGTNGAIQFSNGSGGFSAKNLTVVEPTSGFIGIGTNAPLDQIEIQSAGNSQIDLTTTGAAGQSGILFFNANASQGTKLRYTNDNFYLTSNLFAQDLLTVYGTNNGGAHFQFGTPSTAPPRLAINKTMVEATANAAATVDVVASDSGDTRAVSGLKVSGYIEGAGKSLVEFGSDDANNTRMVLNVTGNNGANKALTATSAGNVGIGTTVPAAKLDVAGTIRATDICDETGANCKDISAGWSGGGGSSTGTAKAIQVSDGSGGFAANNNVAVDTATGFLGVGTSSPSNSLHVVLSTNGATMTNGETVALFVNNSTATKNAHLMVQSGASGQDNIYFGDTSSDKAGIIRYDNSDDSMRFHTSSAGGPGTEWMRIDKNGKVGIGTASPAVALDVSGAILATGTVGSREVAATVAAGATYPGSGGVNMALGNVLKVSPGAAGACPTVRLDLTTMTSGVAYTVGFIGYNSGTCSIQDQTGATTNVKFFGGSAPAVSGAQDVICSIVKVGSNLYTSCLIF